MGGGITGISAVELSTVCTSGQTQECKIANTYQNNDITNNTPLSTKFISIETQIGTFTNYSDIIVGNSSNQAFSFKQNGYIAHFINYGNIHRDGSKMSFYTDGGRGVGNITNYGTMGGIEHSGSETMTINNFGVIRQFKFTTEGENNLKTRNNGKISIQNYALMVNENPTTFNAYTSGASLSHLLINGDVSFKDNDSKIILDFGENFELGKEYLFSKLAVDTGSSGKMQVDFRRLTTRSELFNLTQSGNNFIVNLVDSKTAGYSTIGNLYKSNVRTMNNFWTLSNSMIYPRKLYHSQNLRGNPHYENIVNSTLDSAISLKSYESFAYKNESVNRRIQRQNKRNYNRRLPNQSNSSQNQTQNLKENQRDSQNLTTDSANQNNQNNSPLQANRYERGNPKNQNNPQTQSTSQNLTQNPHDYYFILTPFVNHNLFLESERYNLSGLEYGFLTAFSAQVAESNHLGAQVKVIKIL